MPASVSSVVFFSSHAGELVDLLLALDVLLERESHGDQIEHWAVELGSVHIAVYTADDDRSAPDLRSGGSTFFGLYVDDLDAAENRVRRACSTVATTHQWRPWRCRIIVTDPDGRSIEVNWRGHCDGT